MRSVTLLQINWSLSYISINFIFLRVDYRNSSFDFRVSGTKLLFLISEFGVLGYRTLKGFRVGSVQFPFLGFGFRFPNFGFRVTGFDFQFRFSISIFEFRTSSSEFPVPPR